MFFRREKGVGFAVAVGQGGVGGDPRVPLRHEKFVCVVGSPRTREGGGDVWPLGWYSGPVPLDCVRVRVGVGGWVQEVHWYLRREADNSVRHGPLSTCHPPPLTTFQKGIYVLPAAPRKGEGCGCSKGPTVAERTAWKTGGVENVYIYIPGALLTTRGPSAEPPGGSLPLCSVPGGQEHPGIYIRFHPLLFAV